MLRDWHAPLEPQAEETVEREGIGYRAARWSPEAVRALADRVARGGAALGSLGAERTLAAWSETVAAFRDPRSEERRALEGPLARLCRLSPEGLAAGLEAVLGGVAAEPAGRLFAEAASRARADGAPVLVVLAANLPALAVQPLLPALALGRPAIVKSPSAEPLFAPAFAAALARREPAVGAAVVALTWRGGDRALEAPLLAAAGRVIAYGEQPSLDDLEQRAPGKLAGYGPATSVAAVGAGADPQEIAPGLARDVALFDQRGCLSVAAVYAAGDAGALAEALAEALAGELGDLAARWPPGPIDAAVAAAVQQLRAEADLAGLRRPPLPLPAGTVVVDPRPEFRPTPGLRTVRVHPLADLAALPRLLAPWRGRLQGAALAGPDAEALRPALAGLGVSRFAAPGDLQSPDALWHNGGRHPLEALMS